MTVPLTATTVDCPPGWHVTTATGAVCHTPGRGGLTRCGREIHGAHQPADGCVHCARCGVQCPSCGGHVPVRAGKPAPHREQIVTRHGVRDGAHLCLGGDAA